MKQKPGTGSGAKDSRTAANRTAPGLSMNTHKKKPRKKEKKAGGPGLLIGRLKCAPANVYWPLVNCHVREKKFEKKQEGGKDRNWMLPNKGRGNGRNSPGLGSADLSVTTTLPYLVILGTLTRRKGRVNVLRTQGRRTFTDATGERVRGESMDYPQEAGPGKSGWSTPSCLLC